MKVLAWMFILCVSLVRAEEDFVGTKKLDGKGIFKDAAVYFSQGKYQATVEELKSVEERLLQGKITNQQTLGLIQYWKGITFNRLQNFDLAIQSFDKALGHEYAPLDLHYEYGQALFAADKLDQARLQFRESLKRKFKRGVSLYYIGYISKEMGDRKKAYTFLKAVSKLEPEEAKDVAQPAEMLIGDIYLEQIESRSDAFKTVDNYVIPQYQKALAIDTKSSLAPVIQDKIIKLQRKYDLILFQLRNGRPTLSPPYFLRASQEMGQDTNVTFSPADTTISKSKQASGFTKTDLLGKYTFYHKDFLSIAPEFRFNRTYYFNRVPEIHRNDNYLLAPAVRTAYEHTLWGKPASILFDYEYSEARRDVDAKEELEFSSRAHTLTVGERFNFFNSGESIIRLRHRVLESYLPSSDSTTSSLIFEQIKGWGVHTLLYYMSYDRMRVDAEIFDTDSFTFRGDLIMAQFRDWFTPSFGFAITATDPINDKENRGMEILINPSARLARTFGKNWRANLKYEYQKNNSEDEENFAYTKSIYAFELEYIF
jgi:tetratricopeptide (TPR) repeat protein